MEARAFDVPKYLPLLPLFNALSLDELHDVLPELAGTHR
jgi:hypothetical protein